MGVDDFSDYPPEVLAGLPRVGPDLGIDLDAVVALEPDLVLASLTVPGHERVVEALDQTGLPYLAPAPTSLADVYADIHQIADTLGLPDRGRQVARQMAEALEGEAPPSGTPRPRIAVQWWPKPPILPGRLSWVHGLIERAGGTNALDEEVASRPLEPTELAALDPDILILAWCGVEVEKYRPDVIYRHPAYAATEFVTQRQVFSISEAFLGRPSPRLVDGYQALRGIIEHCTARTK